MHKGGTKKEPGGVGGPPGSSIWRAAQGREQRSAHLQNYGIGPTSPEVSHWLCAGRFPPPADGQSLLTQELIELLKPEFAFLCLNASARPPEGRIFAPGRLRLGRLREVASYLYRLRYTVRRYPFPILYALLSGTWLGHLRDCAAFAWALPPERPLVVWTHNALFQLQRSPLWRRTLRWLAHRAHTIVFAGHRLYEPLRELIPEERVAIIPNFVRRALLCAPEEVERKLAHMDTRPLLRLLFVGHMLPEKGGWHLLRAAALLHRAGVPFHITYVGGWVSPQDASAFAETVAELGLTQCITHRGSLSDAETLRQLYLSHHVVLLPTTYPIETQPMAILEALNAGCAVITTPHATLPELVHTGLNGFLVPQDPEQIAAAVARYWHEPGLWRNHARAARQLFVERFHPFHLRRQWVELLRRVEHAAQVSTPF